MQCFLHNINSIHQLTTVGFRNLDVAMIIKAAIIK